MNNCQVIFYFCYDYINPGKNKFNLELFDQFLKKFQVKIATILMSENFQLHLLKCWYSECYYNQNLMVSKYRKFRGLDMLLHVKIIKNSKYFVWQTFQLIFSDMSLVSYKACMFCFDFHFYCLPPSISACRTKHNFVF